MTTWMASVDAETLWWITLGVGTVVAGVVALLLAWVVRSADAIRRTVTEIWVQGPYVANNTAHLDLLRRIAVVGDHTVREVGRTGGAVSRLQEHAAGCPGCPWCVTGWEGGGR